MGLIWVQYCLDLVLKDENMLLKQLYLLLNTNYWRITHLNSYRVPKHNSSVLWLSKSHIDTQNASQFYLKVELRTNRTRFLHVMDVSTTLFLSVLEAHKQQVPAWALIQSYTTLQHLGPDLTGKIQDSDDAMAAKNNRPRYQQLLFFKPWWVKYCKY